MVKVLTFLETNKQSTKLISNAFLTTSGFWRRQKLILVQFITICSRPIKNCEKERKKIIHFHSCQIMIKEYLDSFITVLQKRLGIAFFKNQNCQIVIKMLLKLIYFRCVGLSSNDGITKILFHSLDIFSFQFFEGLCVTFCDICDNI